MSAVTAKAMNSTIGTGEILGLDILLKNAMMEVLQEDIQDRNKHKGLVAGGKIAASSSERDGDRYFYLGKKEGTKHSFTMKCNGSFAVASSYGSSGQKFEVKKNGTTLHNDSGYFVVSFKVGDVIQIELGAGSVQEDHYIYAKEVDLRALF